MAWVGRAPLEGSSGPPAAEGAGGEGSTAGQESPQPAQLLQEEEESSELEAGKEERMSSKMNTFRKEDRKASLFIRAIERLSFRGSRRRRDKKPAVDNQPLEQAESDGTQTSQEAQPTRQEQEPVNVKMEQEPEQEVMAPSEPPAPAPAPVSATSAQSRPLCQLDSALRQFRQSTAESRENLSISRPDLSLAAVRASLASRPPLARPAPPPSTSATWRQRAPPTNPYMEGQWAKLSASMVDLSRSRSSLCSQPLETSLESAAPPEPKPVVGAMARAASMNVLDTGPPLQVTIGGSH